MKLTLLLSLLASAASAGTITDAPQYEGDDFTFTSVPEVPSGWMAGLGMSLLAIKRALRNSGLRQLYRAGESVMESKQPTNATRRAER